MALATGQILQERYRIAKLLGQGGMGAVYRAWDMRLDVPVALKEMTPQPGLDTRVLSQLYQQFQREAKVLARLSHSHLVRVSDFFRENGNAYLVMEFVAGESLAARIEQEGAIAELQVVRWAGQLLDALEYCHGEGVIHRDVKPQNVVITPKGEAVLVDFGLVKLWDPGDPRTQTVMRGMGTPEYAPPEQYDTQAGHTDPRSDIYGVGATLYHALTSRPPPTVTQRIASRTIFRPPREINSRISPGTEAAVLRAMEMTVEDRFPTAKDMAAALGRKVVAPSHPLSRKQPATKVMSGSLPQPRRSRAWLWLLGLGGLALVALVVGTVIIIAGVGGFFSSPLASSPTPTVLPANTPALTPTLAPTPRPTSTPAPSSTPTPMPPTSTPIRPSPTPEPTPEPTIAPTPVPRAVAPALTTPEQGMEYGNPVVFQWQGSLGTGQAYQVTAYHPGSGHVVQSELLAEQSWSAHLPAERAGEWRWSVSVVQGGRAMATSSEQMFWFNPMPRPTKPTGDITPTPAS